MKGAYQMNRKFLMAQKNHETGSEEAAREATAAFDSIVALTHIYNTQLDGKWNQMMSEVPPGICAKYQEMPALVKAPTEEPTTDGILQETGTGQDKGKCTFPMD